MRRAAGFTLIEVLVALAIFASVAVVVLEAGARTLRNSARLEQLTLASWLADNRLTELALAPPAPGRSSQREHYAGREWELLTETRATVEPDLLRITVWVAPAAVDDRAAAVPVEQRAAAKLIGFAGRGL